MKDMMKKMYGKNDEMKKDAKMSVLQELRKMASGMMGEDLKKGMDDKLSGLKKVTVAATDDMGLKKGLSKAKEMLGDGMDQSEDPSDEMDSEDSMEMEECKTPEEIDAKIAELQDIKKKMLSNG